MLRTGRHATPERIVLSYWLQLNRPDLWTAIRQLSLANGAKVIGLDCGVVVRGTDEVRATCLEMLDALKAKKAREVRP